MKKYTFIDLETTGLDPVNDQIIEVGMVQTDFSDENVLATKFFVQLEGGRELSSFIKDYTHITEDDLATGVTVAEALDKVERFIHNTIVVSHYAPFDLGFISKINVPRFFCTKSMYNVLKPGRKAHLGDICKAHDIKLVDAHRALGDAMATMELFNLYRSWLGERGIKTFMNKIVLRDDRAFTYIPPNATILDMRKKLEEAHS